MEYTFENLNQASILLCREILKYGVRRRTRNLDCVEFPEPVMIHITNITDRYINIKERKHHKVLPFAESLALASGVNHMDLYASYVPSMMNYSDDGNYQRAGYGPRIRRYEGTIGDYKVKYHLGRNHSEGDFKNTTDQLKFVIESLQKDINTRQAIITIHDPAKDCFEPGGALKVTKDQPCSRSIQFMVVGGKLDCTLYIRSNDLLYGLQAVNVFNFTFMQEYVANLLGLPVGTYHHVANNLHYYDDKSGLVQTIAGKDFEAYDSEFGVWQYPSPAPDLKAFDEEIHNLCQYEMKVRATKDYWASLFPTEFFCDWGKVFLQYHSKQKEIFFNPYLNKLFNK